MAASAPKTPKRNAWNDMGKVYGATGKVEAYSEPL
jgi:hypothetical protein